MLFNSYDFLFIFLPFVLLFYYIAADSRKNLILTVSGYAFYAYWDYRFCTLLLASTLWDYLIGRKIHLSPSQKARQLYLFLSIFLNLGLLGYFKYYNFFIESFTALFPFIAFRQADIVLPVGISFFTFQSMSYSIDIYQKNAKPVDSFIDFACYISMFPQLVAGPIVRFNHISAQLSLRRHTIDRSALGIRRFIIGLSKKVLIADSLAGVADKLFAVGEPGMGLAWLGAVSFSLQIYFDFSGYSDMAIGLGRLFGFELPENFNFPYHARGLSDFWRRWHMSLSSWLRDYLYIPLGGSRGSALRTRFNLIMTMLLCGLWHGAAWTFVLWGGYHAVLMMIERPYRKRMGEISAWISIPATYLIVVVGWVFFRSQSVSQAVKWIQGMAGMNSSTADILTIVPFSMILFVIFVQAACWAVPTHIDTDCPRPLLSRDIGMILLFLLCVVSILGADNSPFLYFQF